MFIDQFCSNKFGLNLFLSYLNDDDKFRFCLTRQIFLKLVSFLKLDSLYQFKTSDEKMSAIQSVPISLVKHLAHYLLTKHSKISINKLKLISHSIDPSKQIINFNEIRKLDFKYNYEEKYLNLRLFPNLESIIIQIEGKLPKEYIYALRESNIKELKIYGDSGNDGESPAQIDADIFMNSPNLQKITFNNCYIKEKIDLSETKIIDVTIGWHTICNIRLSPLIKKLTLRTDMAEIENLSAIDIRLDTLTITQLNDELDRISEHVEVLYIGNLGQSLGYFIIPKFPKLIKLSLKFVPFTRVNWYSFLECICDVETLVYLSTTDCSYSYFCDSIEVPNDRVNLDFHKLPINLKVLIVNERETDVTLCKCNTLVQLEIVACKIINFGDFPNLKSGIIKITETDTVIRYRNN